MIEKIKKVPVDNSQKEGIGKLIEEENKKEVRLAISQLPENLRLVIQLKEFSDLDYKSIGKVLGISETNVKVRVHRARKKLEELLRVEDKDVY